MEQDLGPVVEQSAQAAARPVAAYVHYGGPDRPARALRDLLKAHIEAAPPGSEILWVTYYFRDRGLADALVAAQRRGVRVRIVLDGQPRRRDANAAVISQLHAGLGDGLRVHRPWFSGSRLHAKIYTFSGPSPVVFVGSFNPSGDDPDDPRVLADIGDQDRGHNLLIQYRDPAAVSAIRGHAARVWTGRWAWRFSLRQNQPVVLGPTTLFFFPRLWPGPVERSLGKVGRGDRVRAAVSHVERGPFAAQLAKAARRGARVELVVHDTRRRVPQDVVENLVRAGVKVRRYCHPDGLPMHAKFVIVRRGAWSGAWFGSLNHNVNSRYLNHEILVRSTDPRLVSALDARFAHIAGEAARLTPSATRVSYRPTNATRALAPDRACGAEPARTLLASAPSRAFPSR